jgi:hypothetical protein
VLWNLGSSLKLITMKVTAMRAILSALIYVLLLLSAAAGLQSTYQRVATSAPTTSKSGSIAGCLPSRDGFLLARIRRENGAGDSDIDWHDADMQCDGGMRPDERGFRLIFIGRLAAGGQQVRLVFGIASTPNALNARNVPTNVTIIFEDEQKLYSTASEGKCTIDELTLQPLLKSPTAWRRVVARGFCTVPVTAIRGDDALVLDRFDFAGGLRDEDTR